MMPAPAPEGATEPTTRYWQRIEPESAWAERWAPPYRHGFPVRLPDGGVLELPIRALLAEPGRAVASLIANQAALDVVERLAADMGRLAAALDPTRIVVLPTLGLAFAPGVARALGHARYVPLGYSRKFWYDDALSVPVSSVTTPQPGKRLYLDPNQRPLVAGTRVVIVDDTLSSGRTAAQAWGLLESVGAEVAGIVVAMRQGTAWRASLGSSRAALAHGVFDTPRLVWSGGGWWPA